MSMVDSMLRGSIVRVEAAVGSAWFGCCCCCCRLDETVDTSGSTERTFVIVVVDIVRDCREWTYGKKGNRGSSHYHTPYHLRACAPQPTL